MARKQAQLVVLPIRSQGAVVAGKPVSDFRKSSTAQLRTIIQDSLQRVDHSVFRTTEEIRSRLLLALRVAQKKIPHGE